eukprot:scaffold11714_cov102-Skeletonema_dohrnii-CCMP3373.AAC.1
MNISQSAVESLLVPIYHLRESEKTVSIASQQLRTTASIENVLSKDPHFQGITIEPYPTIFTSRQVGRDKVLSDIAIPALIYALEENLPDLPKSTPRPTNKKPTVWIVAVSLLRFGKKKEQLQVIVNALTGISDKLEVKIMPLDCFGVPMNEAILILTNYIDEVEKINREIGTSRDQGKCVTANAHSHDEQRFVSSNAKIIKSLVKRGDDALKKMIERGLNLMTTVDNAKGTVETDSNARITNITIGYVRGREKFVEEYLEALKRIKSYQKDGEELISFIIEQIQGLADFVHDYNGPKLRGMYFRKSDGTKYRLCFGVPEDQFANSVSDMKYQHPNMKLEEENIAIYFDDGVRRSVLTNPKYISYLAALIAGAFDDVYISQPNRIGQDAGVVALHEAACKYRGTKRHFTKAIGKDVNVLADKEEKRSEAMKNAKKKFNVGIEQCRKKYLPPSVDAKAGNVTYELSTTMMVVGNFRAKNVYDVDQSMGIVRDEDSGCLSESESDEDEETGHHDDQN